MFKSNVLIVMFTAAACSQTACAEVIVFDNSSGTFRWIANGSTGTPGSLFDPTLPAEAQLAQSTSFSPRQLGYIAAIGGGSFTVSGDGITTASNIRLARAAAQVVVSGPQPGQMTSFTVAAAFQPGDLVGSGANFNNVTVATGYFNPGLGRNNFLGQHAFVGFRVFLADDTLHFGFIELDYQLGFTANGSSIMMYQPVRWGYELLPNTPVTIIPGPGSAALLVGALPFVGRRRGRTALR